MSSPIPPQAIRTRLAELNTKAYYLLVALSFVYRTNPTPSLKIAFTLTALVAVTPVQDWLTSERKLEVARRFKVALLVTALICTIWWVWCSAQSPAPVQASEASTQAQQQRANRPQAPAPAPAQPIQSQLEERIDALEKRLAAAEEKAAKAELQKDHSDQAQEEAKEYYDKALTHTTAWAGMIALVITIIPGFFALFSFRVFDGRIRNATRQASSRLRRTFIARTDTQLKALSTQIDERVAAEVRRIEDRSKYHFFFLQGLTFGMTGSHDQALKSFRLALEAMLNNRQTFTQEAVASVMEHIFISIANAYPQTRDAEARAELQKAHYRELSAELAIAAAKPERQWMIPLLPTN